MTNDLLAPRSQASGRSTEMRSWIFMRVSGLVLVVLVLGHLYVMTVASTGVQRVNWGFVAGRWAAPFWQLWDLAMLWLAMLHGAIGMRTIIEDYARRDSTRFGLKMLLYAASAAVIGLGTLVVLTFDPTR